MALIHSQPLGEINMTPLIDVLLVLLVLLVMFLLALPAMTHKVTLDLPVGGPPSVETPPPIHRLTVAENGAISLDGSAVASGTLRERLCGRSPHAPTGRCSRSPPTQKRATNASTGYSPR